MKDSARAARVLVSADGRGLVSQSGSVLLRETMHVTGREELMSTADAATSRHYADSKLIWDYHQLR